MNSPHITRVKIQNDPEIKTDWPLAGGRKAVDKKPEKVYAFSGFSYIAGKDRPPAWRTGLKKIMFIFTGHR